MHHQQMTAEIIGSDNTYNAVNTIWDPSVKILAAVIDNADMVPDDGKNEIVEEVTSSNKKYLESSLSRRASSPPAKHSLAILQEEHALWLK